MSMVLETYIAANDNRAKPLPMPWQLQLLKKDLIGKYKMNKKHFPTYESSFNIITRTGTEFMTRMRKLIFKRSGRLFLVRSKALFLRHSSIFL